MKRILLVEDNALNRDVLVKMLNRWGFASLCAQDGAEGVDKALSEKPDLVLMDIALPGIDGLEATRRIKAEPAGRSLPVIALTAHSLDEDRERAYAAGCSDFVLKPIDFPELREKIQRLIGVNPPYSSGFTRT